MSALLLLLFRKRLAPQPPAAPSGYKAYKVSMPAATATSNRFKAVGTTETVSEFDLTDLYKIALNNLNQALRDLVTGSGGSGTTDPARLAALESKMANLFPLTPDVADLVDWGDIYTRAHATQNVAILDGYSLIADYRASDDRYESSGVTYTAGTNVIDYTGLTDNLHRLFGFKVDAPANQTLLSIIDNGTAVPFIDMTSTGRYRVNEFIPAHAGTEKVTNRGTRMTRTAGSDMVNAGAGSVATFRLPDYPSGSTARSRHVAAQVELFEGTTDTLSSHFMNFDTPDENTAQGKRTVDAVIQLGFPHVGQTITVTIGYEFRVSGSDFVVDFTVESIPAGYQLQFIPTLFQNFTAATTVARVDQWRIVQDENGDYTFSGDNEIVFSFRPSHTPGQFVVTPVAVNSAGVVTQLNDLNITIPNVLWNAVRVPDTIEFRTALANHYYIHAELAGLLGHRAEKWCYGIAELNTVTERAVTQPIDLASNVVYNASGTGTATGELVASVQLPTNYTSFKFVHVTEIVSGEPNEWRHNTISTALLSSGDVDANDYVRVQGNTDLGWNMGTRTLTSIGGTQTIYRIELFG